jgi:hypothetical protein
MGKAQKPDDRTNWRPGRDAGDPQEEPRSRAALPGAYSAPSESPPAAKAKRQDTAFDGEGARLAGGRWNHQGTAVGCVADSLAPAALEIFVHLQRAAAAVRPQRRRPRPSRSPSPSTCRPSSDRPSGASATPPGGERARFVPCRRRTLSGGPDESRKPGGEHAGGKHARNIIDSAAHADLGITRVSRRSFPRRARDGPSAA